MKKWLTKTEIAKRAKKSYKEALLVSIEHHQQIAKATRKEFFTAVGLGKVAISASYCGICQTVDNCRGCFLGTGCEDGCGGAWKKIHRAIDEILIGTYFNEKRNPSWATVVEAERNMVKVLKKELLEQGTNK